MLVVVLGLVGWLAVIGWTQTRGAVLATLPGLIYILIHFAQRFGPKMSVGALVALCVVAVAGDALSGQVVSQRFQLAGADIRQYQAAPQTFRATPVRLELRGAALMVAREHPEGEGEEGARGQALRG